MARNLSEGSIRSIMSGESIDPPYLQVLGVRKLLHPGSSDRYRVMISDGIHSINFAMLATQHNHRIESGEIDDNCIIILKHHITSKLNKDKGGGGPERRVVIILDVEVVVQGSDIGGRIGAPVQLSDDGSASAETGANGTANPQQQQDEPMQVGPPQQQGAASSHRSPPAKMPRMDNYGGGAGGMGRPQGGAGPMLNVRPISSINVYQNKWVIRARVTAKTPMRTWSNSRGEGKLFSMDLKDENGEIRATAFKEEADKFYDMIELGKVYYVSNCVVKLANKKFSQLNNDFEITFTRETEVSPVEEEVDSIPTIQYDFRPISEVAALAIDTMVDVIGVCKQTGDVVSLIARATGRELKKRDLTLVDQSLTSVTLTLWGEKAVEFDGSGQPVVAVHLAKVQEYQGCKTLGTPMQSSVMINPDVEEAHRLRGWYDNGGAEEQVTNLSGTPGAGVGAGGFSGEWLSIIEAKESQLGLGNGADYYNLVASVLSLRRENCYYLACPSQDCKKKVIDNGNETYRCEKCNRDYDSCLPRMILSCNVGDWSDSLWVTLFEADAQTLLGVDGKQLRELKENDEKGFNAVFDKVRFARVQMRVRVKSEMYNDETRLKSVVARMQHADSQENSRRLLKAIEDMRAQGVTVPRN